MGKSIQRKLHLMAADKSTTTHKSVDRSKGNKVIEEHKAVDHSKSHKLIENTQISCSFGRA